MIIEDLSYHDYERFSTVQSRIDSTKTVTIDKGFVCPSCRNWLNTLEHGKSVRCFCGMHMTRQGAVLHCIK